MKKTDKKILEEIIRVDHAGERGAIKIYEGQLLALKTIKQNESLKNQIEKMKEPLICEKCLLVQSCSSNTKCSAANCFQKS